MDCLYVRGMSSMKFIIVMVGGLVDHSFGYIGFDELEQRFYELKSLDGLRVYGKARECSGQLQIFKDKKFSYVMGDYCIVDARGYWTTNLSVNSVILRELRVKRYYFSDVLKARKFYIQNKKKAIMEPDFLKWSYMVFLSGRDAKVENCKSLGLSDYHDGYYYCHDSIMIRLKNKGFRIDELCGSGWGRCTVYLYK